VSYNLSPVGIDSQYINSAGQPLVGGLLWWYLAGTTTLATTATSNSGAVFNPNPIVLNANGSSPNEIWLAGGQAYKAVLENPPPYGYTHGTVIATWDGLIGINDSIAGSTQWLPGPTPTYVSGSQFSLAGDQTLNFSVNRRIWAIDNGVSLFGTIVGSSYAGGLTTVTVNLDSGSFDTFLTTVSYAPTASISATTPLNLLSPTYAGGWAELVRNGWTYWNITNQLGSSWNVRPDGLYGEIIDGCIEDTAAAQNLADVANNTRVSQSFKFQVSPTIIAIWIRIQKVGNPANSMTMSIQTDDGSGKPSGTIVTNGTATSIIGKYFSSGWEWVRFVFPTPVTGFINNSNYHIVMGSSGAVDASNYWQLAGGGGNYPYGSVCLYNGTTWSVAGTQIMFMLENQTTNNMIQPNGLFDAFVQFYSVPNLENLYYHECKAIVNSLSNFLNYQEFCVSLTASNIAASAPLLDFLWGLDHNRVQLSITAGGLPQVNVFTDQKTNKAGTQYTVTSTIVVTSGNHFIGLHVRAKGDGADRIDLFVDGVTTSSVGMNFKFSPLFSKKGAAWLGGGMPIPSWGQKLAMGVLPSADTPAWTYTGTATQGNVFVQLADSNSVNKVIQVGSAYASTDSGYYVSPASVYNGFSNSAGWGAQLKMTLDYNPTFYDANHSCMVYVSDGTAHGVFIFSNWWTQILANTFSALSRRIQVLPHDLPMADISDNEWVISGSLNSAYVFLNGRLVLDGSTILGGSASRTFSFGDNDTTAGHNSSVIYDSFAYSSTNLDPIFSGGTKLHEFGCWQGNVTSFWGTLYNSGNPVSIKTISDSPGKNIPQKISCRYPAGITQTISSGSSADLTDLFAFVVGSDIEITGNVVYSSTSVPNNILTQSIMDGVNNTSGEGYAGIATANYLGNTPIHSRNNLVPFGLHKIRLRGTAGAQNATFVAGELLVTAQS
jgi:hypothetical protein